MLRLIKMVGLSLLCLGFVAAICGGLMWSVNQFRIRDPKVYIDTETGCRYLVGKYYIMPALTSDGDVSNCSLEIHN